MMIKMTFAAAALLGIATPALAAPSLSYNFTSNVPVTPQNSAILLSGDGTGSFTIAQYLRSFTSSTVFDDIYTFTLPRDGILSESLSTSFTAVNNKLTFTHFVVNGTSYAVPDTASGEATAFGHIPIVSGFLNTVEIRGFTTGAGGYAGTATFTAAPEPATWAMMIIGFGFVGSFMRRKTLAFA